MPATVDSVIEIHGTKIALVIQKKNRICDKCCVGGNEKFLTVELGCSVSFSCRKIAQAGCLKQIHFFYRSGD